MDKCSAALIELRNAIKQEINDEGAAAHKYADMAAKLTHLRESRYADTIRLIAAHEQLHNVVLSHIVDELTERCDGSG